jgi:phage tail tape-measure protein
MGARVGATMGARVGARVGARMGARVGATMGARVGATMGARVGARVGATMGARMGARMGADLIMTLEKVFKELKSYVVEHIDSWIEKNTLKYEKYSGTDSSTKSLELHPVFDLRKPILLHIQMELCSQTLTEVMKYLSKLFSENNSKITKT